MGLRANGERGVNTQPIPLPFEHPPFRPAIETADAIQPGDTKALIHRVYVDQNGRPVLMYDQFRQEDVTVSDLRNPPALTNPSLTVRYDSMLLQDVFTATWESDPDMSSAWKVWVDFYRDGVWVGAREVAATADQAGLSASGDGAIHRNHAVLTLKNPNGAVVATYTTANAETSA